MDSLFENDVTLDAETVKSLDDSLWPETLQEIVDVLASMLQRKYKLDSNKASGQAADIALELANLFGGRPVYIPKGERLRIGLRNIAIWNDYDKHDVPWLMKKYGLAHNQIYKVINEQKALEVSRRQRSIFDDN